MFSQSSSELGFWLLVLTEVSSPSGWAPRDRSLSLSFTLRFQRLALTWHVVATIQNNNEQIVLL